jgi:tyrosyl-tRNA synthetase
MVITISLPVGLDGIVKNNQSYDNCIVFNDMAKDIFDKIMFISNETRFTYYKLLLLKMDKEIQQLETMHSME